MREWLEQEMGVAPWVFEGVFLPLLAFLAVLLTRELVLLSFGRRVEDRERRMAWRRRTLWVALPLAILAAVGASWARQRNIAQTLAKGSGEVFELQTHLGTATRIIAVIRIGAFVAPWKSFIRVGSSEGKSSESEVSLHRSSVASRFFASRRAFVRAAQLR